MGLGKDKKFGDRHSQEIGHQLGSLGLDEKVLDNSTSNHIPTGTEQALHGDFFGFGKP